MTTPPASLTVHGALAHALDPGTLRALDPATLARYLERCRWFGAKHDVAAPRVAEVVPVTWNGDAAAVVRIARATATGESSVQLPLIVRPAATIDAATTSVIATVTADGERGVLFDALEDAAFRSHVGAALARGNSYEGDGARWSLAPVGDGPGDLGAVPSRVMRGEQSNTSVVYGDRVILKLFRTLEAGENPDVEITRFLTTRTTFRNAPRLVGEAWWRSPSSGDCVAGMASVFVPGARDGWTLALDALAPYLTEPPAREPRLPFLDAIASLGAVTRALHDALASRPDVPGFGVEPFTIDDLRALAARARDTIDRAMVRLATSAAQLPGQLRRMAEAIASRAADAQERLDELAAAVRASHAGWRRTRHHGDYHLGQVLRGADDAWIIVDFEGEPIRPLAERRALVSPLRDVAGMLRSFAYAAATAGSRASGREINSTVETRSARWEREARAAFLRAYGAEPDDPLVALFEMEKVFYELDYELGHRPEWVWIPLRGIARLF